MWHEARRQERKIRQVIVDYKKRSERRHLYYEKIKQDPTKFLQVHGRKCRIHLDGTVAAEADNNNHMMPWQGDSSNMIDRFDVRTHLDYYQDAPKSSNNGEITEEERKCNFERYRVLIWNEYKKISESQHLRQIYIEEQFPEIAAQQKQKQEAEAQKKMLAQSKANIGYDYDSGRSISSGKGISDSTVGRGKTADDSDSTGDEDDELDIMKELEEIPPLSEINMEGITAMDEVGVKKYGLRHGGFGDALLEDQDYSDKVDEAKALEHEKQRMSGRKSRRERRLMKDERLKGRKIGHLSFVRRESSESNKGSDSDSSSRDSDSSDSSGSNSDGNKVEYITSFGSELEGTSSTHKSSDSSKTKQSSALKSGNGKAKKKTKSRRSKSRSRSREQYRPKRARSRSRSRSSSRSRTSRYSSSYHDDDYRPYERKHSRSRDRRSRSRDRRSRSRSSEYRYSRDRRKSRSRSRERRSRSPLSRYKTSTAKAVITSSTSKLGKLSSEEKAAAIKKLTPQEKLKIKMQRALNKQLKVDRNADMEKRLLKHQERMEREDDLREMARKMRKREMAEDERAWREFSELSSHKL